MPGAAFGFTFIVVFIVVDVTVPGDDEMTSSIAETIYRNINTNYNILLYTFS
jgi:hypothetical protein